MGILHMAWQAVISSSSKPSTSLPNTRATRLQSWLQLCSERSSSTSGGTLLKHFGPSGPATIDILVQLQPFLAALNDAELHKLARVYTL